MNNRFPFCEREEGSLSLPSLLSNTQMRPEQLCLTAAAVKLVTRISSDEEALENMKYDITVKSITGECL